MKISLTRVGLPTMVLGSSLLLTLSCQTLPVPKPPEASHGEQGNTETKAATQARVQTTLNALPLAFIENRGQMDSRVAYYLQGQDKNLYFTSEGITFALTGENPQAAAGTPQRTALHPTPGDPRSDPAPQVSILKLEFVGANSDVTPKGEEPTPTQVSYFSGPSTQWKTGIKTYGKLVYTDLWPGIDLVYTGTVSQMKYEFRVKPGADPNVIKLAYHGATAVRLNDAGQLEVTTPAGGFSDATPYSYQEVNGQRVEVATAYALEATDAPGSQAYGFRVGAYDPTLPLVLDPVVIIYSGFFGDRTDAKGIALDASGNIYLTGSAFNTSNAFVPLREIVDAEVNSGRLTRMPYAPAIYVAKIWGDGTGAAYLAIFQGLHDPPFSNQFFLGELESRAIAVDASGHAYITGVSNVDGCTLLIQAPTVDNFPGLRTVCIDYPDNGYPLTVGPNLTDKSGGFVTKLTSDGTGLEYSGYLGASGGSPAGIAVDASGSAYVTGASGFDAFVTKVKADGTGLEYARRIGGPYNDEGYSIAVDAVGNVYVAGRANNIRPEVGHNNSSPSFPVTVGPRLTSQDSTVGEGVPATQSVMRPTGVAIASDGSVYLANGIKIRRVGLDGIITTVAGGGTNSNGDGGPATQAALYTSKGIAFGSDGSLYIAEYGGHRVRRLRPDGIITTVAGTGVFGYSGDGGPATQAELRYPSGVAVGPDGSLYIADTENHRIRRVDFNGIITTVAGSGSIVFFGDGGPATQASLFEPSDVAVGPDGSLYIADTQHNRIRRVDLNGIITTVNASLNTPQGITVGPDGSLYIADTGNHRIRRVDLNGIITTVAGNSTQVALDWYFSPGNDGDGGPATQANLISPVGIAVGPDGSFYLTSYDQIRRVAPDGIITRVAGIHVNPYAQFPGEGFVAKVKADGSGFDYLGYTGSRAANGIAVDSTGHAYITGYTYLYTSPVPEATFPATVGPDLTDNGGTDAYVAKVKADGTGYEYAGYIGGSGRDSGEGIAVDAFGDAYVVGTTDSSDFPVTDGPDLTFNGGNYDVFVAKINATGTGLEYAGYIGGSSSRFDSAKGIAVDAAGNAYIAGNTDSGNISAVEGLSPLRMTAPYDDGLFGCCGFVVKVGQPPPAPADRPDLIMTAVTPNATSVNAGSALSVTDTVTNQGLGATTASFTVGYRLSVNSLYGDGDDVAIPTTRTVTALSGGAFNTATTTLTIPLTVLGGSYYVCALADATHENTETAETNNTLCSVMQVTVPLADLVLTALSTATTTVQAGATLPVSTTTNNQGNGAVGASITSLHLSSNPVSGDGDDIAVGTQSVGPLGVGASSTVVTTVMVPSATPLGSYYLCAKTDVGLAVNETNEGNNTRCTASPLQVTGSAVDLIMTAVTPNAVSVGAGATLSVTNTAKNQGQVSTSASVTIAFRLSVNATYGDGDDVVITTTRTVSALAAGASNTATTSLTIPSTTPLGSYAVCAVVDATNTNAEGDETNNTRCSTATVQVLGPDLVMTAVTPNASSVNKGATLSVSNTATNQGVVATSSSFTVAFHLSVNATYGDGDDVVITTTRTVTSLAVGASNTATTNLTVPSTTPPGSYVVCAMADAINTNAEADETNNSLCSASTVQVLGPDLIMTVVTPTASTVNAGATLSVSNTAINQGATSASSSVVAFRLSPNTTYGDGDDVAMTATRTITSLSAGGTSTATTTVAIPSTTPAGSYYVCAKADANSTVAENDETNNTLCSATTVSVPLPDLLVTVLSTTATTVNAGASVSVANTIKNQGGTPAGASVVAFHLSANAIYGDGDDVVATTTRTITSLAIGATSATTTAVTVPSTTPAGTYYLCAKADANSTVPEGDETNNSLCTLTTVTVPLPDLLVTVLSTTATTASAGGTVSLSNTIKNQGGTPVGSSVVAFRLSANATYGDGDDLVLTPTRTIASLAVGATSATTTTVTLPSTTPVGAYYLCALADSGLTVTESDETNNSLCTLTTVTVPLPDLTVSALSTTATTVTPGTAVSVSNTVSNPGGTPAGSSVVAFHLSTNTTYGDGDDLVLTATRTITSLAAGATSTATTTITLPITTPAGTYYVCAAADATTTVTEGDETNNTRCTTTTLTTTLDFPDLTVSALSTPATTITPGGSVSVTNAVTNSGATAAGSSVVAFHLSSNPTYGDGDDLVSATTRTIASLAVGATDTATTSVVVPSTTPPGTYYLCAQTDDTSTVPESTETNNTRCTVTTVSLVGPDLVVSALSTPATTVTPGASVALANTVTNAGGTAAGSSVVAFRLSPNTTYGDGDDLVLTATRTIASLAVGATSTATTTVVIPTTTPPGAYYLCATADANNTVVEGEETNNSRCTTTTVSIPGPDLLVTAVSTTATTVNAGATVSLANSVKNQGGTNAGSSVVAFRLSPNTTYGDGDDVVLTATRTITSLAVGATNTATTTVTVPTTTPAGTYYLCAKADANSTVAEGDETNNSLCTATTVTVPLPDLLVTALSTTATTVNAGATLPVANTIKNQGGTAAGSSVVAFHLSPNTTYGDGDDVVATTTRTITSLGINATNGITTTVTIPTTTPAGTYYLCAMADATSTVAEGDETNNSVCTTTTVSVPLPDLLVTVLSTTATTVNAGATVSLSNTVKNQGGTAAGSSVVAFRLSPNATYGDGDDVTITTTRTITSLAIGATSAATTTVTTPSTTPPGTYYLCAKADANSTVTEGEETNNPLCTATTVTVLGPDLLVSAVSTTATTVARGASLSLSNSVTNQGGTTAGSSVVAFRLSPNAIYGDGDDLVLTATRTIASVTAGATSTAATTVTIPTTAPSGPYYLCAKADANSTVAENDETNNTLCTAGTITVP